MSEDQDYSTWIVKTRTKRGWNSVELANHSDLTNNAIWQYETRKRAHRPDPAALARIALALDYPPEVLWQLAGIPTDKIWSEEDELIGHVICMVKRLSKENQGAGIDFMEYLVAKQDRSG